jgi:hypothetical protein
MPVGTVLLDGQARLFRDARADMFPEKPLGGRFNGGDRFFRQVGFEPTERIEGKRRNVLKEHGDAPREISRADQALPPEQAEERMLNGRAGDDRVIEIEECRDV